MKKIVCILSIAVTLCIMLPIGMTGVSTTSNHNSIPMYSQEMQSTVGAGCSCYGYSWVTFCICDGSWLWE